MEKKGLRVNAGKTKVMICGTGLDLLQSSGEYPCAVCCTGVGNNSIRVHQGSILSPLLFIIVLEALSCEFWAGVPWEDLYGDDLVIIADSLEECVRRLLIWKEAMEKKGLRVNAGKTKVMICGTGLDFLQSSGEYPCAVCRTGVGNISIYCNGCKLWVHKKCSGLQRLTPNPDYRCAWCMGNARPIDGRPQNEVQGATTSSHIPPPLLQDTWPCIQLLRAERHAPCQ